MGMGRSSSQPGDSPEDIPVAFAQAWNARDPDALASLFDGDAEFVHVTGQIWPNRESIRKELASRLGQAGGAPTLTTGDTKVKLLSPDVAVVHSRMTLSGEAVRTTIVSFVVHRVGDRWVCASAHNTDLIPEQVASA